MQPSTTLSTIDRLPLLALGGMDRGQDQVVLVEQRHAGLVAGRVGRIERQLGQESFARWIAGGDLLELEQVSPPRLGVVVDAVEMRFVPEAGALEIGRPVRVARDLPKVSTKAGQSSPARGGARMLARAAIGSAASAMWSSTRCAVAGPTPGSSCSTRKPATRSRGFSAEPQQRQHVLDVGGVEELQSAELDERDVAARQFDFERTAVVRGAEQHRLLLQERCRLSRFSRMRSTM